MTRGTRDYLGNSFNMAVLATQKMTNIS